MKILAHRGLWKSKSEQNSLSAIRSAFESGFGVETDLRDCGGTLVISHDPPKPGEILLAEHLFEEFYGREKRLTLALNLKADGLEAMLKDFIKDKKDEDYFVFDMSVPDTIPYLKNGYRVYTRWSEYEQNPAFLREATGIWCDFFSTNWLNDKSVAEISKSGKSCALVSPELHGREHCETWAQWRDVLGDLAKSPRVLICTDHPEEAEAYFNG